MCCFPSAEKKRHVTVTKCSTWSLIWNYIFYQSSVYWDWLDICPKVSSCSPILGSCCRLCDCLPAAIKIMINLSMLEGPPRHTHGPTGAPLHRWVPLIHSLMIQSRVGVRTHYNNRWCALWWHGITLRRRSQRARAEISRRKMFSATWRKRRSSTF